MQGGGWTPLIRPRPSILSLLLRVEVSPFPRIFTAASIPAARHQKSWPDKRQLHVFGTFFSRQLTFYHQIGLTRNETRSWQNTCIKIRAVSYSIRSCQRSNGNSINVYRGQNDRRIFFSLMKQPCLQPGNPTVVINAKLTVIGFCSFRPNLWLHLLKIPITRSASLHVHRYGTWSDLAHLLLMRENIWRGDWWSRRVWKGNVFGERFQI